ncbi:hypothetical protein [Flavobacterium nitrogenifigens]|uniref:hypothetical protein n=1 Tax=Flavobacterium nitrogenifigens TaxID=1617283 RepID=UPI0031ACD479
MKLTNFLSVGALFCTIAAFSQNVASTATLTSGGLNAGTSGTQNTFYGYKAGKNNSSGDYNTFIGNEAGNSNTLGSNNTYIGALTGDTNYGNNNTFIGSGAGGGYEGNENIFIGIDTGNAGSGNNNIFIGNNAGFGQITNNRLVIENNGQSVYPLIWGDFAQDQLKFNGKVGIGYGFGNFPTTAGSVNVSNYNLFVKGGILTEEVRVNLQGDWADYVFSKDYELMPLQKIEIFIKENGHLPNMPSAKQVKEEGIELGQIAKMQQEKIEELTLHMIEQNKTIEKQSEEIKELKELVKQLIEK